MYKELILMCSLLTISSVVFASDSLTCANSAGTIIKGAVTGHEYCKSNSIMNWWNAVSWCDGQGRRLFELSDCACGNAVADCIERCPELKGDSGDYWIWTATPKDSSNAYIIRYDGYISHAGRLHTTQYHGLYALCF